MTLQPHKETNTPAGVEESKRNIMELLKARLPQEILGALEYRGFNDCGKYLGDNIWEGIESLIFEIVDVRVTSLTKTIQEEEARRVVEFLKKRANKEYRGDDYENPVGYSLSNTMFEEALAPNTQ